MKTYFSKDLITYDGSQLSSHFAFKSFDLLGDSIVSFEGPCDIKHKYMIDLVDRKGHETIYSPLMLHFIAEFFNSGLEKTVLRQRLLISVIKETLDSMLLASKRRPVIERVGDDLYVLFGQERRKLSVSIATKSLVSGILHTGLNIETEGVPVPAAGLTELNIEGEKLAKAVMESYKLEMESITDARSKVLGVE